MKVTKSLMLILSVFISSHVFAQATSSGTEKRCADEIQFKIDDTGFFFPSYQYLKLYNQSEVTCQAMLDALNIYGILSGSKDDQSIKFASFMKPLLYRTQLSENASMPENMFSQYHFGEDAIALSPKYTSRTEYERQQIMLHSYLRDRKIESK